LGRDCVVETIGQLKQLKHILDIARRQPRYQMHELIQPPRLLVARAEVVWAIHLSEEEFRDLAVLRLIRKVGMVAPKPLRLESLEC
jgi:hypothetical protein